MKTTISRHKISIIIPIYNAAQYLEKAIFSVLNQNYSNLELILIDDGSTDTSFHICESFAKKDQRIILKQIENSGPANARNIGIDMCSGEFIFFLDADDYINKEALSIALNSIKASHADLLILDFNKIINGQLHPSLNSQRFSSDELLLEPDIKDSAVSYLKAPNKNPLFAYSWGRLFRTEIIKKYKLSFNAELHTFEDVTFNFNYLHRCNKVHYINSAVYNHLIHEGFGSATMTIDDNPAQLFDFKSAIFSIRDYLKKCSPSDDYTQPVGQAITTLTIIQIVRMCGQINRSNFQLIYNAIVTFTSTPEIKNSFKYYKAEKGNSVVIPYFLRSGLVIATIITCMYKAAKRYKR